MKHSVSTIFIFAVIFTFITLLSFFMQIYTKNLPDHDISNLKESKTSTKWKHTYCCSECNAPIKHEEFMTKVCLTCGQLMCEFSKSGALRRIVKDGKWIQTIKIGNDEYENVDGNWTNIQKIQKPRTKYLQDIM